jgi:spore maturation protein CgeB
MSAEHKALVYAENIFKAASDYDVTATELVKLTEQIRGLRQFFSAQTKATDIVNIDQGAVSFTVPALRGKVELNLFFSTGTVLEKKASFLCSVKPVDICGRNLLVDGLNESTSAEIGHYFYITETSNGMCSAQFNISPAAEAITFTVRRLKVSGDVLNLKPYYQLLPQSLNSVGRTLVQRRGRLLETMRAAREDFKAEPLNKPNHQSFIYVMDEFTEACILSALPKGFRLSRENFIKQLSTSNCTMLFLESTWNGNNGEWKGAMTYDSPTHEQKLSLKAAIQVAKVMGLRTVFYNKEDPMHFDKFLPIAAEADVILTSDSDCLSRYQEAFPDKVVEVMKFAAPTATCNPAGAPVFENRKSVAFAGGYYGENHDDRVEQMDYILPAIEALDGIIFDRHSKQLEERYRYPLAYQPFCHPAIPYAEMVSKYRDFKVFLNVNTIVESPTMLSRRVYELLACGTPVVSSPSAAIIAQFGDVVTIVETAEQAIAETSRLVNDKNHWMRRSHLGYRHVMNGDTYDDRAEQIMRVGNDINDVYEKPFVSMITPTKEPGDYVRIIENAFAQNYEKLELVVGFGYLYSKADIADFIKRFDSEKQRTGRNLRLRHVHFQEKVILGYKLNALIHEATGEVIAKMDDDDYYGPNYISDMVLPMRWGGFDLVGKNNTFWYDVATKKFYLKNLRLAHRVSNHIFGATFVGRRTMFLRNPFPERRSGEDTIQLAQLKSKGYRIYSTDPFNFCVIRRESQHTWDLPADFWEKDCEELPEDFALDDINI